MSSKVTTDLMREVVREQVYIEQTFRPITVEKMRWYDSIYDPFRPKYTLEEKEYIANQALWQVDPEFARSLGITEPPRPPLRDTSVVPGVHNW